MTTNIPALAIFAKTIGLSALKTRLQSTYAVDTIHTYYQRAIAATNSVAEVARTQYGLVPYWMLAEEQGVTNAFWQGYNTRWSGEGSFGKDGLGERLHAVYSGLRNNHKQVVLIGSDTPHMPVCLLGDALRGLACHQCVVGPTVDGGFYLFAGAVDIPQAVWTNVAYSSETTLLELTQELRASGISIRLLPTLADTDTPLDLHHCSIALANNPHPTDAQKALLHWFDNNLK